MTEQPELPSHDQPRNQPQYGNQPQTPPPPQPSYRRLTRSSWDSPVSGVCGGLAQYLGVDPTLVRVLAAIAMLATFPLGPIVYVVLWAVIPKQ